MTRREMMFALVAGLTVAAPVAAQPKRPAVTLLPKHQVPQAPAFLLLRYREDHRHVDVWRCAAFWGGEQYGIEAVIADRERETFPALAGHDIDEHVQRQLVHMLNVQARRRAAVLLDWDHRIVT